MENNLNGLMAIRRKKNPQTDLNGLIECVDMISLKNLTVKQLFVALCSKKTT